MSIYEFKTQFGVPVIPKDAPRRVTPPLANLEATLAAMQADAKAWKRRKADAWGEGIAVKPERLTSSGIILWTPEQEEALADEIISILNRHGSMTMANLHLRIVMPVARHKLRTMLTGMKRDGLVCNVRTGGNVMRWHIAEPGAEILKGTAIQVPVRGVDYPSIKACARAFNISCRTVQNAIARGRTDQIGLGNSNRGKA